MTAVPDFSDRPDIRARASSQIEKCLEYRFLGSVTAELLSRGLQYEVLRSEVDCHGYDIMIAANGIIRHVQLKTKVLGGKATRVKLATNLEAFPAACVVWMTYDPASYDIVGWRWLGSHNTAIPALGDKVARHTKGNRAGEKLVRADHRIVNAGQFERVSNAATLVERLFDLPPKAGVMPVIMAGIAATTPEPADPTWLRRVRAGDFDAIPDDIDWDQSVGLAHLIDGYALASAQGHADPFALADHRLRRATASNEWTGDALDLWISLFLEHRRWRLSSPFEPEDDMRHLLDRLVQQLRASLMEMAND